MFSGDDDGKEDDGQSVASVGEEYEPISDDELDEILADSQKKEDQQDDEKITGKRKCILLKILYRNDLQVNFCIPFFLIYIFDHDILKDRLLMKQSKRLLRNRFFLFKLTP